MLNYLDTEKHYKVIAATHDIELSEYLKANYENYHFNESIENNQIYFDYKIKKVKQIRETQLNYYVLLNFLKKYIQEQNKQLNKT